MKQKLFKLVALAAAYGAPLIAAAQIPNIDTAGDIPSGRTLTGFTLTSLLDTGNSLVDLFVSVVVVLSLLYIVFGGLTFIMSAGNEDKVKEAKNRIIYGVIGIAVIIVVGGIYGFVASIIKP